MYVSVLTALDLQPGMAFLNVGSGSGYLSCLAACLLGKSVDLNVGLPLLVTLTPFQGIMVFPMASKSMSMPWNSRRKLLNDGKID
jgi:hypothetical protein